MSDPYAYLDNGHGCVLDVRDFSELATLIPLTPFEAVNALPVDRAERERASWRRGAVANGEPLRPEKPWCRLQIVIKTPQGNIYPSIGINGVEGRLLTTTGKAEAPTVRRAAEALRRLADELDAAVGDGA